MRALSEQWILTKATRCVVWSGVTAFYFILSKSEVDTVNHTPSHWRFDFNVSSSTLGTWRYCYIKAAAAIQWMVDCSFSLGLIFVMHLYSHFLSVMLYAGKLSQLKLDYSGNSSLWSVIRWVVQVWSVAVTAATWVTYGGQLLYSFTGFKVSRGTPSSISSWAAALPVLLRALSGWMCDGPLPVGSGQIKGPAALMGNTDLVSTHAGHIPLIPRPYLWKTQPHRQTAGKACKQESLWFPGYLGLCRHNIDHYQFNLSGNI